jgi:hypothetical protein
MSISVHSSEPVDAGGSLKSLSAWSIISLVLFALAIAVLLVAFLLVPHHAVGPADAAALMFLGFVCVAAELACTVLGMITGLVGVRRSRGYPEWPWAGLALNGAVFQLQLVLPSVMLAVSAPRATWVVAAVILIVGIVFAALIYGREFVGRTRRPNDPVSSGWGLWWVWCLGVACATGVMVCLLRLTEPG